jgi:branched-chain amino acid transport system substrate-binding protein
VFREIDVAYIEEPSMKRIAVGVAFCLAMAFAVAVQAAEGPLKVGVVLPLTGDLAKFGETEKNSFLMGLEEINQSGGVNGRPIELVIEDDAGKPDVGKAAVERLISRDSVLAVTGGYVSAVTYAMCALAQQRKVPFLVTRASADKITEQGWDYVFRINPPVSEYPDTLVSFLAHVVRPRTVAILYENTPFGQSGAREFARSIEESGIKVIIREAYEAGDLDLKALLIKAKAAQPDLVYMVSCMPDAARLMGQARELDVNPKLYVGGGFGFTLPEFAQNAGDAAENVYATDLWAPRLPYPGAQEYFDKYRAKFGIPTECLGVQAYSSIYVIADALKRSTELTPQGVRDALAATDTMTVFGPVKFIAYGKKKQQNSLPTYLLQWQEGTLEAVWPETVASRPYVYPVPPWPAK